MSIQQNEIWLEAAYEHFRGALDVGNYPLALDVIEDTRDKGFELEAKIMHNVLMSQTVNLFTIHNEL